MFLRKFREFCRGGCRIYLVEDGHVVVCFVFVLYVVFFYSSAQIWKVVVADRFCTCNCFAWDVSKQKAFNVRYTKTTITTTTIPLHLQSVTKMKTKTPTKTNPIKCEQKKWRRKTATAIGGCTWSVVGSVLYTTARQHKISSWIWLRCCWCSFYCCCFCCCCYYFNPIKPKTSHIPTHTHSHYPALTPFRGRRTFCMRWKRSQKSERETYEKIVTIMQNNHQYIITYTWTTKLLNTTIYTTYQT